MQLQRLTGLERQKILDELAELLKTIERLRAILSSDELLMQIVVDELKAVREKYGDERRTEIIADEGEFRIEDLIADEDMAITVTQHRLHQADGDHHLPQAAARRQGPHRHADARGGLRQPPLRRLDPRLHHDLLGPRPRLLAARSTRFPTSARTASGKAIANLVSMEEGEQIAALLAVKEFPRTRTAVHRDGHRSGVIKKTELTRLQQPARRRHHRDGRRGRRRGDRRARSPTATSEIFIGTRDGMAIRFAESRRAADGPHRLRRARHHAARGRRGRGDGSACAPGGTMLTVDRERLRQAHRARRVPRAVARRHRHHQHPDQRPQRQGGRHRLRHDDDELMLDHAAGQDPADGVERHPHDRPRHAGRAADRHRRGRSRSCRSRGWPRSDETRRTRRARATESSRRRAGEPPTGAAERDGRGADGAER